MAKKKKEKEKDQAATEPKRITPVDIQQKEFRVAFRGYHEKDVDEFLDEVTEEVARLYAENKRLREDLEFAGTTPLGVGEAAEADALLRMARDEADRIVEEARAQAASMERQRSGASPGGSATLGPFISRERRFLQSLADLIQSHAEAVKAELRRARDSQQIGSQGTQESGPRGNAESEPQGTRGSAAGGSTDEPTQAWVAEPEPAESTSGTSEPRVSGEARALADADAPMDAAGLDPTGQRLQDRTAELEGTREDWTGYYAGPTTATRSGETEAEPDEDIVDLTAQSDSGSRDAIGGEMHSPAGQDRADHLAGHLEGDEQEDRSLRELFWGEE